jgi:isopentenyldiphosphate isomerase
MTMEPYTRKDLEFQRKAYQDTKARTFVENSVDTIYFEAIKVAVERSSREFYHTISTMLDAKYIDIDDLATSIRDELVLLFPDFTIEIGVVNDGCNRSRYICVTW